MDIATALLSIWGGAGPLLGAGVSAWWTNRNRIADREWTQREDESRREREALATARNSFYKGETAALERRRATFIEFYRGSYDFLWMAEGTKSIEAREKHRERFTNAFSVLMLLDQPAIGAEALAVWNACQEVAGNFPNVKPETFSKLHVARAAFAAKAHAIVSAGYLQLRAQPEPAASVDVAKLPHEDAQGQHRGND